MKKLLLFVACALLVSCSTTASAQKVKPSGNVVSEEFKISGFTSVSASSGIDVYITQTPEFRVRVKTDENILPYLSLTVNKGVLHIGYAKKANLTGKFNTVVYINMPQVKSLLASSGAEIKTQEIKGESLSVKASSAGEIKAIIDYKSVDVEASSGADVELKGKAQNCTAEASSGSDIDMEGLRCVDVTAKASSGANIDVYASRSIHAKASSGAEIEYHGNPKNVNITKSSGGSVTNKR